MHSLLVRKDKAKPSGLVAPSGPVCPNPEGEVKLTVRLDRALHARLRVLAARQRRTNQDIVEGALEAYLNIFGAGCACARDRKSGS